MCKRERERCVCQNDQEKTLARSGGGVVDNADLVDIVSIDEVLDGRSKAENDGLNGVE